MSKTCKPASNVVLVSILMISVALIVALDIFFYSAFQNQNWQGPAKLMFALLLVSQAGFAGFTCKFREAIMARPCL